MNASTGSAATRSIIYVENVPAGVHGSITRDQVTRALEAHLGERAAAYEIVIADDNAPDYDALREAAFFVSPRFDTNRIRQHAPALRVAHCLNAGLERFMPLDWLPSGAHLTNSSGVHADMIGEYGVMALLMLNHHVHRYVAFQQAHRWEKVRARSISGKTVLIVGTGSLGSAIASRAKSFGVTLVGVSRSGSPVEGFDRVARNDQLDALLPEADFVILACPLTEATRYMIGEARLSRFKHGASLINVGRGPLVDTRALAAALEAGRLAGAVLDVQETEPVPPDSPWWDIRHMILTPHISCDTDDGYFDRGLAILAENVARLEQGQPLRNVVDLQQGY